MTAFAAILLLVFCNGVTVVQGKAFVDVYVAVEPEIIKDYLLSGTPTADVPQAFKRIEEGVKYTMAEVNNIYQRIPGLDIEIRVIRLDMLNVNVFNKSNSPQGRSRMVAWRDYLTTHNIADTLKYDIALLFTGQPIKKDNQDKINLPGISFVGTICTMDAMAVVRFRASYSDVLTTVHEIGHVLGLANDYYCQNGNIMAARVQEDSPNKWDFSQCSIQQLKKSIPLKTCLNSTSSLPNPSRLPPKEFLDIQGLCKRHLQNSESYLCTASEVYNYARPQGDAVCGAIYCDSPKEPTSTSCNVKTDAPNLMVCGEGKRCQYGKCMDAPSDFPAPSDVKNDCLFGDGMPFGKTCEKLLNSSEPNVNHCITSAYVQAQCCNTCVTMGSPKVCSKQCGIGETRDDKTCSCAKNPCPSGFVRNINTGSCDVCFGDQGLYIGGTLMACPKVVASRPDLCQNNFTPVRVACCQTCANTKKPGQA